MVKECKNCQTNQSERERKEQLAQWISKEITSREYTDKEMKAMLHFSKTGQNEKLWKILLKDHQCPTTCYCQQPARTWQEKIQQGTKLTELAEKRVKEAQELRVKETTKLLFKNPQSFFNSK